MSRASVMAGLALGPLMLAGPLCAQSQPVADRYGPAPEGPAATVGASPFLSAPAPPSSPGGLRGRMLSWPGKIAVAPPPLGHAPPPGYAPSASRYAPSSAAASGDRSAAAYGPVRPYARRYAGTSPSGYASPQGYGPPAGPPVRFADARTSAAALEPNYAPRAQGASGPDLGRPPTAGTVPDGWRPVFAAPPPQLAGAPAQRAPGSSYPAAAVAGSDRFANLPPPRGSAAQRYGYGGAGDHAVRFYSVHRPFGLQPDAAPIPPQFFTNTADLAAPPAPLPTERTSAATTGATRSVRAAPDAGAD